MANDGKLYLTGYSGLTSTDIGTFLKRTLTTAEASLVSDLITEVEYEFARRCGRNFKINDIVEEVSTPTEYYEYFTGDFNKVMTQNTPLSSMVAIEIDGEDKTSLYTEGENYWIYDNYIRFASAVYSLGYDFKAIKITYTLRDFWGEDVKLMLKKWISYEFLNSENAGVGLNDMSFADLSQNFDVSSFMREREKVIFAYTDFEI